MTQEHAHVNINKQQDSKNNVELLLALSWTAPVTETFEKDLEMC